MTKKNLKINHENNRKSHDILMHHEQTPNCISALLKPIEHSTANIMYNRVEGVISDSYRYAWVSYKLIGIIKSL